MTPLEHAARALCKLDGHPPDIKMDGKPMWQDYLPEVRAVVGALREPSRPMIDAALGSASRSDGPEDIWHDMIDAVLSDAT